MENIGNFYSINYPPISFSHKPQGEKRFSLLIDHARTNAILLISKKSYQFSRFTGQYLFETSLEEE